MNSGEKITRCLIIACRNRTKLLDLGRETLNQMTRRVYITIGRPEFLAVGLDGITAVFPAAMSGLITLSSASKAVSASSLSTRISGNSASSPPVRWTPLDCGGHQSRYGFSCSIHRATARSPSQHRLSLALALCWRARTMVMSIIVYSLSAFAADC